MKYQVQEMLRVERIFEAAAIEEEIDAYNPLIPDGSNWKATFMIEYEDVAERRAALATMIGIEHRVWVKVGDTAPLFATRERRPAAQQRRKNLGRAFPALRSRRRRRSRPPNPARRSRIGIDHPALPYRVDPIPEPIRASLVSDLD